MLMVFPVLYTLYLSFTNWNLTSGMPRDVRRLRQLRAGADGAALSECARQDVRVHVLRGRDRGRARRRRRPRPEPRLRRQEPRQAPAAAAARGHAGRRRHRVQSLLRSDHRPRQLRPAVVRIAARPVDLERQVGHPVADPRRRVAVDADDHAHRSRGPRRPVGRAGRGRAHRRRERVADHPAGSRFPWSCRSS